MTDAATISVAIVDDHPALREGTASLLEREPDLRVVGLAGDLHEARSLLDGPDRPDVIVLDIRLGPERGLDLLAGLASMPDPRPAIVVWTAYDLPQYAAYAQRHGASGFVLKTAPTHALVEAIRSAAQGGSHFATRAHGDVGLTEREHELVEHVVDGRSNDEMATAMGLGTRTVEAHLTRLYERYGVQSRAELAVRAVREGWLDLPASDREGLS